MNRAAFYEPVTCAAATLTRSRFALLRLCVFASFITFLVSNLAAQTGNVVVSTNTSWATGTYNLTSLTVMNGAVLTIGGGSSVTVSGAVLVTANSNVVLQSINNAAQVNNTWQGAGVTLNAGSVQVDPGSSINADSQGYLASAGPAGAPGGSSAGGSYGGLGGSGNGPTPAGPTYGSDLTPTDLGSGGGSRCCGAIPGNGGGAIRLIVSGTLTDNGIISANGGNLVGYQGGGGAGGSLWVTAGGLAGSGFFSATGGTGGEAAGGGGRIAVYYNATGSTFTGFATSTTAGGSCGNQCSNGTASAGVTGTVAFFDTSSTNTSLMVNQDFNLPSNTVVTYDSITVQPGAVLTIGGGSTITVTNLLTVSGTLVAQSINNSALFNNAWQGHGVIINAASVVVNAGGSLNADGQGYVAGAGPGGAPAGSSAGGSYAGLGGVGNGVSPGGTYGSTTTPTDLGSGGNTRCCGTIPGQGGGALFLTVSGTLTDNGVISANGGNGVGLQVGGGAGGTVSIQTATLTGSGSVTANGGLGGEAGGGGGRVALYYNTNNGFDLTLVTSNGGPSSSGNPGTIGTVYTLGAGANLTVSNNTVLPPNVNLSYNSITVNNASTLTLGSNTTLASNTVTVSGGGNFTVGGGSTLNITGAVLVTGNSKIVLQSVNNAALFNGAWQGKGLTVNAGSVQVDPGSSINADGQGYLANAGPGGAPAGSSAGGSYGGMGGSGSGPVAAGPIYGSNNTPTDLGSGGGSRCCGAIAGPGGGAIRLIVSGTLTDNGIISANGANLIGYQGGGGAGGSVWVTTAGLVGSGVFTANGGTGGEAAGGGGRIAIYYDATLSNFTGFSTSTSNGAGCGNQCSNGTASAGSVGTAAFFDTSAINTNLMVDQDLTISASTNVTYNSITVQPGAVLTIGGGSTLTVTNLLTVSGTVIAQSINNTASTSTTTFGSGISTVTFSNTSGTGTAVPFTGTSPYSTANYVAPVPGTVYLTYDDRPDEVLAAGLTSYTTTFLAGAGGTGSVQFAADNAVDVYLNGIFIGTSSNLGVLTTANFTTIAGINTLRFDVTNYPTTPGAANPTALDFGGSVTSLNNTGQGTGVTINAASIIVNPNGSINADGQGYVVSVGPGGALSGSSTGGSYGGLGGLGLSASPSAIYGSTTAPVDLGSGGGYRCCSTSAGAGGGALTFNVSGTFTNNGIVSANGGPVIGYQAGGGSGGSVYVKTAALSGSGAFTANGGMGGEAAGGGGRMAIYYDAPSSTFTGFTASTATGGLCGTSVGSACANGPASNGGNGTSAFFDTSAPNNNLSTYQNFTIPAGTQPTYNTIAVQTGALLTIGGSAAVTVTNAFTITGTVVAQSANNTAQVGGGWSGTGVAINAGSITINPNGSLNADAQGYVPGAGPGGAPAGSSAGGSYGGLGGTGNGVPAAGTYGSTSAPADLGSGGNTRCCATVPGPGGGALLLTVTGTLTDNGVISSNGGNATGLQVGGGSGGSVNLHVAALTGSGTIAANGGSGGEAGGGGGRLAICFNTNSNFNLALATATGGASSNGNAGSAGTIYTQCGAGNGPPLSATVNVTAAPAVVDQGSLVTFTGIVSPTTQTTSVPTGTLTFTEGPTLLATVTLVQSAAAFSTSALAAGLHVITVTYSGDAIFQPSSFTFNQVIRAIPSISWPTPAGITYGTPLSPTQLNATASSPASLPGTFAYQPAVGTVLNAGQQTLTVVFTPSDLVNFAPATKSVSILVGQAAPTIAWSPAVFSISYGTPLGAQQLNATARGVGGVAVAGAFVYTPAAGTVLTAGTQTLNVVFTPSNTNYTTASSTATITVTQVTPTLTWPAPSNLAYGIPLSATQLNATATGINATALPGTFVYTPAAGTVLNPGAQTLSVTFTPTDAVDYTTATTTVTVTITDLILTSITPNTALIGDPAKTITLTGSGFITTTVVMVNGTAVATTYVNPTTLTAVIPATNFATAAVLQITLTNPSTRSTSAAQPLTVAAPVLAATFTGPTATQPGTQPVVTLSLSAPYPLPLTATFTLTQKSALPSGVVDPAVQFATGGTTYTTTIPAGSTTIPPIQVQSGTVAGTITIPVVLTANGINVTPSNLAPVTIVVPAAVPSLSTASLTRGGTQLSVAVIGFSNTREIVQANFHFTPIAGATLTITDITAPVASTFATWFADPSSLQFGSAFTYTQNFIVSDDAANIASVQVTLTNSTGQSTTQTAQ